MTWSHQSCIYYSSEMQPTLRNVIDAVFEVRSSAAPGHVLQTERLVGTQHDDLDGARLEQGDLIFCCQLSGTHTCSRSMRYKSKPDGHCRKMRVP